MNIIVVMVPAANRVDGVVALKWEDVDQPRHPRQDSSGQCVNQFAASSLVCLPPSPLARRQGFWPVHSLKSLRASKCSTIFARQSSQSSSSALASCIASLNFP